MMEDPGYADWQDPRLQPPEREEVPTGADAMDECAHAAACERLYRELVGVDECEVGWVDAMCRRLGCGEGCCCWEP